MTLSCPSCRQKQRIPPGAVGGELTCEACGTSLEPHGTLLDIEDTDFEQLLERASRPMFVHFWAPWCESCRRMRPEVEQLARRHERDLWVVALNTVENPRVAIAQGIRHLPTFALFEQGRREQTASGYMTVDQLERQFEFDPA